jgi:subtilisin family serine protease
MRRHLVLPALFASAVLLSGAVGEAQRAGTFPVIVLFHPQASLDGFAPGYQADDRARSDPQGWGYVNRGVAGAVQALERQHGFAADHVYSAAVRGFAGRLTARQIDALENDARIALVEPDGTMVAIAQTLPWGVDRIDADLSSTLAGDGAGVVTGVNVYVIDSGVDTKHTDLNVVRQ